MKKHLVAKVKSSPMREWKGTGKTPQGKTVAVPKRGTTSKPKKLVDGLRQTEGYVPKTSLPTEKRAGGAKARERRLEKLPM